MSASSHGVCSHGSPRNAASAASYRPPESSRVILARGHVVGCANQGSGSTAALRRNLESVLATRPGGVPRTQRRSRRSRHQIACPRRTRAPSLPSVRVSRRCPPLLRDSRPIRALVHGQVGRARCPSSVAHPSSTQPPHQLRRLVGVRQACRDRRRRRRLSHLLVRATHRRRGSVARSHDAGSIAVGDPCAVTRREGAQRRARYSRTRTGGRWRALPPTKPALDRARAACAPAGRRPTPAEQQR